MLERMPIMLLFLIFPQFQVIQELLMSSRCKEWTQTKCKARPFQHSLTFLLSTCQKSTHRTWRKEWDLCSSLAEERKKLRKVEFMKNSPLMVTLTFTKEALTCLWSGQLKIGTSSTLTSLPLTQSISIWSTTKFNINTNLDWLMGSSATTLLIFTWNMPTLMRNVRPRMKLSQTLRNYRINGGRVKHWLPQNTEVWLDISWTIGQTGFILVSRNWTSRKSLIATTFLDWMSWKNAQEALKIVTLARSMPLLHMYQKHAHKKVIVIFAKIRQMSFMSMKRVGRKLDWWSNTMCFRSESGGQELTTKKVLTKPSSLRKKGIWLSSRDMCTIVISSLTRTMKWWDHSWWGHPEEKRQPTGMKRSWRSTRKLSKIEWSRRNDWKNGGRHSTGSRSGSQMIENRIFK